MHKARHDAAILGALSATVALILGLATPSYGRIDVAAMSRTPLPAREAPHVYPAFHAPTEAHETSAPDVTVATETETDASPTLVDPVEDFEGLGFSGGGEGYSDDEYEGDYWADNHAWNLRYYHFRNQWQQQWAERRERMRRARLFDVLSPGNASGGASPERRFDPCAVFSRACARGGSSVRVADHVATLTRQGASWMLANDLTALNVNPERLCAITVASSASLPSNPALHFATPTPAERCQVAESGSAEGVAVEITWQGDGWSQRAVVSLADGAESPEATVSVVRANGGGHTSTFLANLSGAPMEWVIAGRAVTVAPGAMTRVRG